MTRSLSSRRRNRPKATAAPSQSVWLQLILGRVLPALIFLLFAASLVLPHVLLGGVKLLFSIPGYLLLGTSAILLLFVSFRRVQIGARGWPVAAAIAFVGYIVTRTHFSPVEYLARADRFMALAALLVYVMTAFYFTTARQRVAVVAILGLVAAVDLGAGLLQFVRGDNSMSLARLPDGSWIPQIFRPDYGERASGLLGSPNHLAGFLETLGSVLLALTCLGRYRAVHRMLLGAATAVAFVGVAFTGSRGGYLSTATAIAAFLILTVWVIRKLRPKRFLLIAMIAIITGTSVISAAIALMSSNVLLSNRMANVVDTSDMRSHMWAAALAQFHLAPTLGTGSGTFLFYGRQFRHESVQNDSIHVHNDYFELLAEYGVIGGILAAAFLILHLHSGWKGAARIIRKRLRPAKRLFSTELALVIGAFTGVLALLAHSVVDFNTHIPSNTLFFAFLFAILASPSCDLQISGRNVPRSVRGGLRIALPAAGVVIICLTAPLLAGEYFAEWARVQLRSQEYVDFAHRVGHDLSRGLPTVSTGTVFPDDGIGREWPAVVAREHILPRARHFAEEGARREDQNPDLHYYLGEVRHLEAMLATDRERRRELTFASARAYERGYQLFPSDVRLHLRLARAYDNLDLFQPAEMYFSKAFAADPKLGNVYASYGFHLWQQRKLARAEAYYAKALSFGVDNEIARAGLDDIRRLRALAADPQHVELYGNPLENYDLDPPDEEDARRGVKLDE